MFTFPFSTFQFKRLTDLCIEIFFFVACHQSSELVADYESHV